MTKLIESHVQGHGSNPQPPEQKNKARTLGKLIKRRHTPNLKIGNELGL